LSPCPNPEKLRQLYWDYEFFYRHPMAEPQYSEEEYGCEEKFVYDLAVNDRNQGRKKNLEEFKKEWLSIFPRRFATKQKADANQLNQR